MDLTQDKLRALPVVLPDKTEFDRKSTKPEFLLFSERLSLSQVSFAKQVLAWIHWLSSVCLNPKYPVKAMFLSMFLDQVKVLKN